MAGFLDAIRRLRPANNEIEKSMERPRIVIDPVPDRIYAVGDVHGCHHELLALEAAIVADAAGKSGSNLIVMLGDYVDRGPASASVLEHLMRAPPSGFTRVCLRGNHEEMMLGAIRDPKSSEEWLTFGGRETLVSYGIPSEQALSARRGQVGDMLAYYVPEEHANWIAALPVSARAGPFGLVHAGVRPGVPFAEQADEDLMWIRSEFLQSDVIFDPIIVHGHTPQSEPNLGPGRIGIDTGCFATGVLTAVRLEVGEAPVFLTNRDTPVVKRVAKNRRPQR